MYAGFVLPVHMLFPEAFQNLDDDEFGMLDDLDEFGNLEEESEESDDGGEEEESEEEGEEESDPDYEGEDEEGEEKAYFFFINFRFFSDFSPFFLNSSPVFLIFY